jgi:DNA-binding response OmpR family regulator
MTPTISRVLIAEDSSDVAKMVAFGVRMLWPDCDIVIASSGSEALAHFTAMLPDLVILDVTMPPPDGFEVCQRIRATSQAPIMMLTVRDATLDKVRALDLGADDYLTKPFDHLELLARLRAIVRRSSRQGMAHSARFVVGDVSLDVNARTVQVRGETIQLTPTEFRLLEVLLRHAGSVLPHQQLLDEVWGPEYKANQEYLKVFIRRLRQKLGDDMEHPRYIQNEWGIGYRFLFPG